MTQIKPVRLKQTRRISKQDWLNAGLDLLQSGGIEAVRVERLAAQVGVAKSGFYYHFRDRADFHAAILDHWVALDRAPLVAIEQISDASPDEKLRRVAEVVDRNNLSRYDFAVRLWAQQDARVRRVWGAGMKKRIGNIRNLFEELGFKGDALEMRTRIFVAYHVTERDLFPDLSARERRQLREERLKFLLLR